MLEEEVRLYIFLCCTYSLVTKAVKNESFCIKIVFALKFRAYKKADIFAKMYRSRTISVKKLDKLTKCSKNNILVWAY